MEARQSLSVAYCADLFDGFKALLHMDLVDWDHKPTIKSAI